MKLNVLLFTQTMHSLLKSSLTLQDALMVCSQILTGKSERKFTSSLLKKVNEGMKLSESLEEYRGLFLPIYVSLVSVGETSGNLGEVFGRLSEYLKDRKNLRQKLIQALVYPVTVMICALIVVAVLVMFVLPRLEEIFFAFQGSAGEIELQIKNIKRNLTVLFIFIISIGLVIFIAAMLHRISERCAWIIDSFLLRLPGIGKIILTVQMHDFSFAMKLLSSASFPLVDALKNASFVMTNRRVRYSVENAARKIADGSGAGTAFESEGLFPKYLTVWIKIAQTNGNTFEAFSQICDYYWSESENIFSGVTSFVEPFFILLTGVIIILVISQFVVPVFNLLGAL